MANHQNHQGSKKGSDRIQVGRAPQPKDTPLDEVAKDTNPSLPVHKGSPKEKKPKVLVAKGTSSQVATPEKDFSVEKDLYFFKPTSWAMNEGFFYGAVPMISILILMLILGRTISGGLTSVGIAVLALLLGLSFLLWVRLPQLEKERVSGCYPIQDLKTAALFGVSLGLLVGAGITAVFLSFLTR